jgi:hypothetical protein
MDGEGWKQHAPSIQKSPVAFSNTATFQCFKSGSALDSDSIGSADLDPDPYSCQAKIVTNKKGKNYLL